MGGVSPVLYRPVAPARLVKISADAAAIVDTSGKFVTGINNDSENGGKWWKFATGVADTGGKFATGVVDTSGAP
jgi:hypothetical protein